MSTSLASFLFYFFYKHFRISAVRPIISAMDGRPQVLSVSFRGGFVLEGTFNAIICALHSRIIDAVEASFEEDAATAAAGSGIAQSNAIAAWAWVHDYVSWILRLRSEIPMKQTSKKTPLTARSPSLGSDQFWTSANTRTGLGQIFSLACIFNSLNCNDSSITITITSIYFSYESTILISSILTLWIWTQRSQLHLHFLNKSLKIFTYDRSNTLVC